MESSTATRSATKTIAGLIASAAARHRERAAVRCKRDGSWQDLTYAQVEHIVRQITLGLLALHVQRGERVCILANTRPEWSYVDLAITDIGAVAVPIYQTNSPEECGWVISDSGASVIFCEDESQLAKIIEIREQVPDLRAAILIEPPTDDAELPELPFETLTLEQLKSAGEAVALSELETRRDQIEPDDVYTIIYTSGTTGFPKGCVLTHRNYRAIIDMVEERGSLKSEDDAVVYLYLPLAHSFALLLQLVVFDLGLTLAYFGGDTKQVIVELAEVKPTYLPSVPRIFEKIYTLVSANVDAATLENATKVGIAVRDLESEGKQVPAELQRPFEEAEEKLFKNVRAAFGGRLREAVSGAAPIAREILEFFYACGVPVLEGYGMTETATAATVSTREEHRFGSVGKPLPGVQAMIAPDGELLIKGPNVFAGYYRHKETEFGAVVDGWLHTGDLGEIDDDGYVYIVGRKKDLIITAGGKNITPANFENEMKRCRWVSQAVMHGDRRPYPVMLITLDEEEILPWARQQGLPEEIGQLAKHPKVIEMIQEKLDEVNRRWAQVAQVKKFTILDHDLSQQRGELTPTLKVKRSVIESVYASTLDAMYAS